jgi:hypothetical protein
LLDPDPHSNCGSGSRRAKITTKIEKSCVADPDPHVFGPPRSGSTSQRYRSGSGSCSGSGSFDHHAKIVRKTLIPNILLLFLTFIFENDVNVASKSNKHKKLCSKISFLLTS